MAVTLEELLEQSAAASGPAVVAESGVKPGGVDPLGLRQINFDLMDLVLPGLNNVARHIRPFVVVAWAWRRAKLIAEKSGSTTVDPDVMKDFVDRIEAIYAWSQFLLDPQADLPGRVALAPVIYAQNYTFGGEDWDARREVRRYSTGLVAPINYGPALKSMQWILPHPTSPGVFVANPDLEAVLDAFEAPLKGELGKAAFNRFGSVKVQAKDVARWGELWALDEPTKLERLAAYEALGGKRAVKERRIATELIELMAEQIDDDDLDDDVVRAAMCKPIEDIGSNSGIAAAGETWRRVQVRQVFRLALEGMFYWLIGELSYGPQSTSSLAAAFLEEMSDDMDSFDTAAGWFDISDLESANPTEHLEELEDALRSASDDSLPQAIANALAFCMTEAPEEGEAFERPERLPLYRAKREFDGWAALSPHGFISNVIESWVIAQHVFWSVGRGLADARARGKIILRLRIVMDEGGWTLTPGVIRGSPPEATPDRLATVLSLLREAGHIK